MDQQGHGYEHAGSEIGAGAFPFAQHMHLGGDVPAFEPNMIQTAHPDGALPVMVSGQPLARDGSPGGNPMTSGGTWLPVPTMMANSGPVEIPANTISPDDVALYDRQIRLWGMAAQQKIQNAHILLITMRGLAHEVAKNLVLAGVGSITLLDGSPVTEADLGCQFFLSEGGEAHIGQNRAEAASHALRKLNPRVRVHVDAESVRAKGSSYFAAYDIIIATDLGPDTFNIVNTAARINRRPFYAAGTHGMYGFIFSDLIEHDFVVEREAGNVATKIGRESRTRAVIDIKTKTQGNRTIESVTKRELYSTWFLSSDTAVLPAEFTSSRRRLRSVTPALSCLRALWEFKQVQGGRLPSNRDDLKLFTQMATQKHRALSLPSETLRPEFLRSFLQNLGSEIAPVTAILGGQLSQDVINVLGQSRQPIQNTVILDGTTMEALMYPLHPELELGASLLSVPDANSGSGTALPLPPAGDMTVAYDANAAAHDAAAVDTHDAQPTAPQLQIHQVPAAAPPPPTQR